MISYYSIPEIAIESSRILHLISDKSGDNFLLSISFSFILLAVSLSLSLFRSLRCRPPLIIIIAVAEYLCGVVAINVLIGAASITSVLLGYIKYEKRFLADKPDIFVVGSVVGIAGLLTADCFLSRKYYKKFDKSE
ncbi:Om14p [Maudiozyma barnettii]|uniref:Similar to Saccharomyces cerevisiae YBR230C OM14 Integral mitochondrial outer membrane protein n=1 Tax=Maudiozyma barnettii TaxID=61262 RepID=A0A8H2VF61_9SACH|nr:Om14p [Kazachstania barnettii]CAB4254412.1 similar to Saccharomyces cerevisiae YBR230C OM14 Integral mitochondrial outer membrane protein [Kazachstania barnettii]